jgi:hypothetical protein
MSKGSVLWRLADAPAQSAMRAWRKGASLITRTANANRMQNKWIEGDPVRSFWLGLSFTGRRVLDVTTFGCTSCGILESEAK